MKQADVQDALVRYLDRAQLVPMDRLPPERDLAARLGCSRATLRLALERLQQQGRIWRHVGQGTFVGPRPRHLPAAPDQRLIEGSTPQQLMEARLLLEPAVAAAAARQATPRDVALLTERVEDGRRGADRAACELADDAFHRTLATVAGNPIVIKVMGDLSLARRRSAWQRQWDQAYRRLGVEEFRTEHSDQHMAVVTAIARADPSAAAQAMRHHLTVIERAMRRQAC